MLAALGWHWAQATPFVPSSGLVQSSRPFCTTLMYCFSQRSWSFFVNSSAWMAIPPTTARTTAAARAIPIFLFMAIPLL